MKARSIRAGSNPAGSRGAIHLTKEREHSELQTIDFLFFRTRSKMVKGSVHNLEACAFFSYIHG